MKEWWHLVEAGGLTLLLAGGLGWLGLGLSRVRLRPAERWPAAVACGTPLAVALLMVLGPGRKGVLVAACLAAAALAVWRRGSIRLEEEAEPLPRYLVALLAGVVAIYGWFAFRPHGPTPAGWDDAIAGAAGILHQWRRPGWDSATLWMLPYRLTGARAVVITHVLFLLALALAVLAAGRRWLGAVGAATAALLVFTAAPLLELAGFEGSQILFLFCVFSAVWLAALAVRQRRLAPWAALVAVFAARTAAEAGGQPCSGVVFQHLPWMMVPFVALAAGWLLRRHAAAAAVLVTFQLATVWPDVARQLTPAEERAAGSEISWIGPLATGPRTWILVEGPVARTSLAYRTSWDPSLLALLENAHGVWRERRLPVAATARRRYEVPATGVSAEIRFYRKGVEVPRRRAWRVRPPAAGAAFDNRPLTGCACVAQIDFGQDVEFDEVRVLGTAGTPVGAPRGLRRAAVMELKRQGVTHVLAREGFALSDELHRHAGYWGVREESRREGVHLFALE